MGIEDLKFRLANQYVQNKSKTEEGKVKKEYKPDVEPTPAKPETKEVGDKLLTEDPKMLYGSMGLELSTMKAADKANFVNSKGVKAEVDIKDAATLERLQKGFVESSEMKTLNEIFNIDTNQNAFLAGIKLKGIDTDKLNKHLAKGLDETTANAFVDKTERIATLLR